MSDTTALDPADVIKASPFLSELSPICVDDQVEDIVAGVVRLNGFVHFPRIANIPVLRGIERTVQCSHIQRCSVDDVGHFPHVRRLASKRVPDQHSNLCAIRGERCRGIDKLRR